jgi:hypothetical protein
MIYSRDEVPTVCIEKWSLNVSTADQLSVSLFAEDVDGVITNMTANLERAHAHLQRVMGYFFIQITIHPEEAAALVKNPRYLQ